MHIVVSTDSAADGLQQWEKEVKAALYAGKSCVFGLLSGSRSDLRRGSVDAIAADWSRRWAQDLLRSNMLLVRTEAVRDPKVPLRIGPELPCPDARFSPLGHWCEVTVTLPANNTASWLPEVWREWVSQWRARFRLMLIQLGPIHHAGARQLGSLTDGNFIVLGPEPVASPSWIMSHVRWHEESGSSIRGTILCRWTSEQTASGARAA